MTKIKICGLSRKEDIDFVNEAKPDYIGFILHFPKSLRNVSEEQASLLKASLSPDIQTVGVFVDQPLEIVERASQTIGLDVIQLHGEEDESYICDLRERTGLPIWKAFRIRSAEDLQKAERSIADEILLDSGYGSGEVFDWNQAASFKRPIILAGGLTPENIPEAISALAPKVVDVSSGVEKDGKKDRNKIMAAVRAARTGGAPAGNEGNYHE